MATLGTTGPNGNLAPAFSVPAANMTLLGYTRDIDKPAGTPRYRNVRVRLNIPFPVLKLTTNVLPAILAVVPGTKARGKAGLYDGNGPTYARVDVEFAESLAPASYGKGAPATAAQVTSVLNAIITNGLVKATGAAAGSPGTFTPATGYAPLNLAGLTGVTAAPATAWTTGQRVVLNDGTNAYWNGTTWTAGIAP